MWQTEDTAPAHKVHREFFGAGSAGPQMLLTGRSTTSPVCPAGAASFSTPPGGVHHREAGHFPALSLRAQQQRVALTLSRCRSPEGGAGAGDSNLQPQVHTCRGWRSENISKLHCQVCQVAPTASNGVVDQEICLDGPTIVRVLRERVLGTSLSRCLEIASM